jgi:hypothetical protein
LELAFAALTTTASWEVYRVTHGRGVAWLLFVAIAVVVIVVAVFRRGREPNHEDPWLPTKWPEAVAWSSAGAAGVASLGAGLLLHEPGKWHAALLTAGVVTRAVRPLVGLPPDGEDDEEYVWPTRDDEDYVVLRERIERPILPPRI